MSDVQRLGVHRKNTDSLALQQVGRSLEMSAGQDQQPHLPQEEGHPFHCSDQLKVFPPLLGETSGIC